MGTSITRAFLSVSSNGILAYRSSGGASGQLSWLDRQGHNLGRAGGLGDYQDVAISPDATRVAHNLPVQGSTRQMSVLDLARGADTRLTFTLQGAASPAWSPDGKRVAFSAFRGVAGSGSGLFFKDAGNSGTEQLVFRSIEPKYVNDWSRDGRFLVYTELSLKSGFDLWALPDPLAAGDHKPIPVATSAFNETQG